MPESLFKQLALVSLRRPSVLDRLREQIIGILPAYARHGPTHASTCYVWPSPECPVGCGHCNYASPVSLERLTRHSVARDPDPVQRLMNSMGLRKAVLSGGGEPTVEPGFCELFVNRIDSPNLADIELITAAHFATGEASTDQALRRLVDAWRTRSAELAKANFAVRISLDWFHAQRIGVGSAANVIRRLSEPDMNDVGCYIRSVLLDNDTTMADTNQLYHLTELLLASPERRMYAMLRALELHVDEGRVTAGQARVDRAWRALAQEGVSVPDRRRPG